MLVIVVAANGPKRLISSDIGGRGAMSDILIRDIPEDVLSAIDANATRLGLSRDEYLRRELSRVVQRSASSVTANDLQRFASMFSDLTDPDVMTQAWR
jgi:hypothetical protein